MIEFGARLSLRDNMYATLQRNLNLQRSFTEQIERTSSSIRGLGSQSANPTITANDRASDVIENVRDTLNMAGAMNVSPEVAIEDSASGVLGAIQDTLEAVNSTTATPEVEVEDQATTLLGRIRNELNSVGRVRIAPRAQIEDEATAKVEQINNKLRELGRKIASPFVRLKDSASTGLSNITHKLKEIATTYTPIVKIRDLASQGLAKIKNTLSWLGKAVAYPALKLKDLATSGINKVRVAISTIGKLVAQPIIRAKDTATSVISKVKDGLKTVGKTVASPFISLKDKASPIVSKLKDTLKTVGKTVAKPFIALKDGASKVINSVKNGLKAVGSTVAKATVAIKDGATAGLSKIKDLLGTLAKGVTIAVGLAGAGAAAMIGGSLSEGAKLQQSRGGIETLYTKTNADGSTDTSAVDKMLEYANQAYKTTGLSANAYMENVTSFSASLLSAVSGDTNKAAEVANKAMIDMADNANKMGTDMESIQNAYQGFAKQNYTMLDNLKLGYGGTKEEMERLLSDAQKLTGTQYNIDNLADVYTAIGVIQDQLNITGTTAKEAEQTFSGSFASMKASAQNLLGNLSVGDGEAVARSMGELITTASTFFFGNFVPMLQNIFSNLPSAVSTAVSNVAPMIKENVLPLITSIKDTIFTGLSSIGIDTGLLQNVLDQLFNVNVDGGGLSGMFSSLKGMFVTTVNTILQILPPLISAVPGDRSCGAGYFQYRNQCSRADSALCNSSN